MVLRCFHRRFSDLFKPFFSGCCVWNWCLRRIWQIYVQTSGWRYLALTLCTSSRNYALLILINICFHYLSTEALSRINAVIRQPNALQSENVMAYDNAVSALGKICQFHRDRIDAAQVHALHHLPRLSKCLNQTSCPALLVHWPTLANI